MNRKLVFTLLILSLLFISCGGEKKQSGEIRIAEQYGLAYAPLLIMKEKKMLEEINPDAEVSWIRLGNTAAIREAVLAGDLDIGFMGIPPFLIARDKGMEWKLATGLSQSPLGLVVPSGRYDSLDNIPADAKIALPQPGSIQHILLTMALERELGDSALLDSNLISMKHPDGMSALLSGAVEGHFTSPPYLFLEEDEEGFEVLLSGNEAMGGPFTFIAGAVTEKFHENQPELYSDFLQAVELAIEFIEEEREESVQILSRAFDLEESVMEDYLYSRGMVYKREIKGLDDFIDFMSRNGYITNISSGETVHF